MTQEFFSWGGLATYAGATFATTILTQWLKKPFAKIDPQYLSYIVALVLLVGAAFFTGSLSVESGLLCLLNAVVVSLASNGTYDGAARITGASKTKL